MRGLFIDEALITRTFFFFFFWEREIEDEWERGKETIPSRLCAIGMEPDLGLDLMNREIMTWAEIKSRTFNWLSHPDAPNPAILTWVD